jgi:hypothetical protein
MKYTKVIDEYDCLLIHFLNHGFPPLSVNRRHSEVELQPNADHRLRVERRAIVPNCIDMQLVERQRQNDQRPAAAQYLSVFGRWTDWSRNNVNISMDAKIISPFC